MKGIVVGLLILMLASCAGFQEPELRGGEQFKLNKIEGGEIKFTAGANVFNGNGFAIKVKPSELDLYIEEEYYGKLHLDKKIRMKRKSEQFVDAPFTLKLEQGALLKAMKLAGNDQIAIRMTGKVKGGVWFVNKKFDVNETKVISGSDLRIPR